MPPTNPHKWTLHKTGGNEWEKATATKKYIWCSKEFFCGHHFHLRLDNRVELKNVVKFQ